MRWRSFSDVSRRVAIVWRNGRDVCNQIRNETVLSQLHIKHHAQMTLVGHFAEPSTDSLGYIGRLETVQGAMIATGALAQRYAIQTSVHLGCSFRLAGLGQARINMFHHGSAQAFSELA